MNWFDYHLSTRHVQIEGNTGGRTCGRALSTLALAAACWLATGCGFYVNHSIPSVSVTPASDDFGSVQVGVPSPPRKLTLTNNSFQAISISSLSTTLPDFAASSDCPVSPSKLAPNATCTVKVALTPAAAGLRSGVVTVSYTAPDSPAKVPLTGTGVAAQSGVALSPGSLSWTNIPVGQASPAQQVTLTNGASTALAISSISVGSEYTVTSTTCPPPSTVAAGASCTISIAFQPVAPGLRSDKLTVIDNDPGSPQLVALNGLAVAGPAAPGGSLLFSPTSLVFPATPVASASASESATLSNQQTTPVAISGIAVAGEFAQTNNCPATLAASASCTFSVSFLPTSTGAQTGSVTVTSPSGTQSLPLSGTATGPTSSGTVEVSPAVGGLYFYNQIVLTQSTALPVTITNNQSTPFAISSITSTADYPFTTDCVGSAGGGTVAAHSTCTVQISFYPQAIGKRPAALTITGSANPISIPLTGTGIAGDPGLTVTVGPHQPCSLASQTEQFTAFVTGTSNTAVNWYVNDVLNGNPAVGTITADGLYAAPAKLGSYSVKAISQDPGRASGDTTITVSSNPGFTIYPFTASLPLAGQQTFQPRICNAPDAGSVTWTVDNIAGGNPTVGTVTNNGVYTAPSVAGSPTHTVGVTDAALKKTSSAVVTIFSNIAVDFDFRTNTSHPIPADMFGAGRGESLHSLADRQLLTQAGVTVSRLYAQIPLVYATPTPDWTKIDPLIAAIQAAGQKVLLQMSLTPPWLQPTLNPCGTGNDMVAPADPAQWAKIAASYVAHMDATFPGTVRDYEIWNEPNATGLCTGDHLKSYIEIYSAAAPLMKKQAGADGATIRVGGPALSGYSSLWLTTLLNDATTAPFVDFVSYHEYMFGGNALQVQWDTYNGNASLYQQTQDPGNGAEATYAKVYTLVKAGKEPLGANTPIYISEFNTNFSFFKDCCRNDPTYAPLWNALYITDLLDSAYSGLPVPNKMVYFAGSAYPWFCLIGVPDQNSDCLYSSKSVPQPYPQYYAFELLSSRKYLGLVDGGYLAKSVNPHAGAGGLAVTAFYNQTQDAIVITNPTPTAYTQIEVSLQNVGFGTPQATLYQIVNGALINSSSLALTPLASGYSASISIPAYSVQAISVKGP